MTDVDNLIRQLDEKDAEIGRLESLLDRARPLARKNLEQAAEIEELKAEIAALKQNDANREALLDSLLRLRNEHILEIAALREYVRWRETGGERRMAPLSAEAIAAFGRALEAKP